MGFLNGPGTDLLEVPTIYVWPMFQAYGSGDIPPKYGLICYSTSILGSWNSHFDSSLAVFNFTSASS